MLKTKVIFIICIFLGSLSTSSPIFWPHSLNLSSKKSVFFQKPDIGNSWPWVVSHVSASPSCRDFTFKVKAKITTQLSQMKANEKARKLEKSSNSIFINALAYWFQWIQVYHFFHGLYLWWYIWKMITQGHLDFLPCYLLRALQFMFYVYVYDLFYFIFWRV